MNFDTIECADCCARYEDKKLVHEKTCPLGRAIDDTTDADREWFDSHPFATEYRRAVTLAEQSELRQTLNWPDGRIAGRVQVVKIGPGLRARRFEGISIILVEAQRVGQS